MMEFLFGIDWGIIAKTALGAGIGTAAVQGGISLYREAQNKKDHAAYLALRVAVTLEAYASECCTFYFDNINAYEPPGEQYPAWNTTLPALPPYPDDTDGWRAMDRVLAARCLNFRNRIFASQNNIRSTIEFVEHQLELTLDEECSARGVEAWEIATSLRNKYSLERPDLIFDYAARLQKILQETLAAKEVRDRKQAEIIEELQRKHDEA